MQTFTGFSFWGNTAYIDVPSRVRLADELDTPIEAICRSIARRNRGLKVANCRHDCTALDRYGNPEATHYELTIGKPLKTGGYAVEGRVWVSVRRYA